MRTLDVVRIEYCSKQQQQQHSIYDVREGVEEARVHHQNDKSQTYTRAYPYYLHTRTGAQSEDVVLAVCIAGSANANPSERHKADVECYRNPVYLRPEVQRFVGCWHIYL